MKKLIFILALISSLSLNAYASMECTGLATDGKYVTVSITTEGIHSLPVDGKVEIFDGINTYGYPLMAKDLSQYYERALFDSRDTFVGLVAYVESENPIDLYYSGENFADQDLKTILTAPGRQPIQGSQMVVWKGPGNGASEQFQMADFACGVW